MMQPPNPSQQPDSFSDTFGGRYAELLALKLDPRIAGLKGIYAFGDRAAEAIMLGLSRPFHPANLQDVSSLIDQWERRDKQCCYQGSVQDLFSLTNTMVFALSYRHAAGDDAISRKGPGRICKFQECDEHLFKAAMVRLGKSFPTMMVWCDQILSTNVKYEEKNFRWYHVGLLPYTVFSVLHLSSHIPDETIEKRVWIRAERSLGRMGYGYMKAHDVARKLHHFHLGSCLTSWDSIKSVCKHILSGYWPEESGYWRTEYYRMKQWALGVLCRGGNDYFNLPLFHEHDTVDNTEILLNLGEFATLPLKARNEEPFIFTGDKRFFLKASAWNLSLRSIWQDSPAYVSHYMAQLEATRFSWWQCETNKLLFGCMSYLNWATTILAIEMSAGYIVFRGDGDRLLYEHGENMAGSKTKEQIRRAAQKAEISIQQDLEWNLLYCSSSTDLNDVRSCQEVLSELDGEAKKSEVVIAPIFRGMTTKLFNCAKAKAGADGKEVARRICECVKEWNEYVKRTYADWISVRDTTRGPAWLEGFSEEKVSFGFLEFLTNALILKRVWMADNCVKLADAANVVQEVRKLSDEMGKNERCLVEELLNEGDQRELSRRDVARYLLCGGFSKMMGPGGLSGFLKCYAREKNYWTTMIMCRDGVMQIRFSDLGGEKRIAQRKSSLENYSGNGVVHPDDYEVVKEICVVYDSSDERSSMMVYWNDMEDTTSRGEMWRRLKSSKRVFEGREVLLVDMTVGEGEEDGLAEFHDVFRHVEDPFVLLEQAESGEAEESSRKMEDDVATMDGRVTEKWLKLQDQFDDRFREAGDT